MTYSDKPCCVCEKPIQDGHTIVLTTEEKAAFVDETAPDEVHYCKPCYRVLTNRTAGAELLKGFLEMTLRRSGVNTPKQLADAFHAKILKTTARKLH